MAAMRAGALGLNRSGPRYFLYNSGGRDWSQQRPSLLSKEPKDEENTTNKGKGYGIALVSPEMAQRRWKLRRSMLALKIRLSDWCLYLAAFGLILAMIDCELCATELTFLNERYLLLSTFLRSVTIGSTICLLFVLLSYHVADTRVYLIETGSDSWKIAVTKRRLLQLLIELLICAVCPVPETGRFDWPILGSDPVKTRRRVLMPHHVLLTLPMFGRLFLLARYIVLHSSLYQDTATRTIASLNHISVDVGFVIKSQMYQRPLYMVAVMTGCFWLCMSWMLTQCERYTRIELPGYHQFADFVWFEIITFFSIGYGDIQVQTYCGRALAMGTAIVGTLFSSILIALMGRKMALSSSEKRVNHLIAESQLGKNHKNAAARVLQSTWRVVLRQREADAQGDGASLHRLRTSQRRLLENVQRFRKTRWRQRMQQEDEDDYFTARRAFMETEERLSIVRKRQTNLNNQMGTLFEHVQKLTEMID